VTVAGLEAVFEYHLPPTVARQIAGLLRLPVRPLQSAAAVCGLLGIDGLSELVEYATLLDRPERGEPHELLFLDPHDAALLEDQL
jgi:hypothetical protein